jgi:hypothetical protein
MALALSPVPSEVSLRVVHAGPDPPAQIHQRLFRWAERRQIDRLRLPPSRCGSRNAMPRVGAGGLEGPALPRGAFEA